jgi:CRISPR system Cascade subunit CasA
MNLLTDPWMPVRLRNGQREWIAPDRLSDPEIVAFDADRPDFNGALAQFAIGLLQTTNPACSETEWRGWFKTPPSAKTLQDWFASVRPAFVMDGEGPRFMQDIALRVSNSKSPKGDDLGRTEIVQQLLLECAGENSKVNDNTDHFVKRKAANFGICPACAAASLYTLQSSASGGGRGYLTSIRGGGPLTTLVQGAPTLSLWHDLWLNVIDKSSFLSRGDLRRNDELHHVFPWMADLKLLQPAGISTIAFEGERGMPEPAEDERPKTQPSQVHPAHVFWGMPRRIRLDFVQKPGSECHICGRLSDQLVESYAAKNYGLNYKGPWDHPLSPYYLQKGEWLPVHPQSSGLGYQHWLGLVAGSGTDTKQARVVEYAVDVRGRQLGRNLRLWAFGYDMDKMKAKCWYEASVPLYGLPSCAPDDRREVAADVGQLLLTAEQACGYLLNAVKMAWFRDKSTGKLDYIDKAFWTTTESAFYRILELRINAAREGRSFDRTTSAEHWLRTLQQSVLFLFDDVLVGAGRIDRQRPNRIANARRKLVVDRKGQDGLFGKKLRESLGLQITQTAPAKTPKKRGKIKPPPAIPDTAGTDNRRNP